MQKLNNGTNSLIEDVKTIEWLVDNTDVSVFNPITFNGYQRKIDPKHCQRLVDYLQKNDFLPVAIICACDNDYNENLSLRIVDGQHRVEAFKIIKKEYPIRYNEIKNVEMPIIVLEKVKEEIEIETFITINKTSKKVDTSLAYFLKHYKLQKDLLESEELLRSSKAEYLAVMTSINLNEKEDSSWYDKIIYEGSPKNIPDKYITLNSFIAATKPIINYLFKNNIISLRWHDKNQVESYINWLTNLIDDTWHIIHKKWNELDKNKDYKVLHSAIGYTAINKFILYTLKNEYFDRNTIEQVIFNGIESINISFLKWKSGGEYSKYSSSAGHSLIARELIDSIS